MNPRILPNDPTAEYWFEEGCFVLEQLNDAEDPALSVARIRVPAGGTTRWHRLAGITERYVILSGHGRVEVGELAPREVSAGDLVIIPPGIRQRIANAGEGELVFLALCTPRFTRDAYQDADTP